MKLRAKTCLCIATLLLIGAASPANALSPGLPKNKDCNEEVFQNALNELRSKDYEQGRRLLTKLVGRKCSLAPAAMLLIADSYYREGGSRNLAEAESGYGRWLELFPVRDMAPLVMKKTVEVHLRQLNGRDGSNHPVKAAVLGGGVYDLQREYDEAGLDGIRQNIKAETGMTEEAIKQRSSVLRMDRLRRPVLILHGEKDINVPVSQAYLLRDRLTALKKEFEIQTFPDRDHAIGPQNLYKYSLDFLKRKLAGEAAKK